MALSKKEQQRLDTVIRHTQGTMEVALIVGSEDEAARLIKAKAKKKWNNLVEVRVDE